MTNPGTKPGDTGNLSPVELNLARREREQARKGIRYIIYNEADQNIAWERTRDERARLLEEFERRNDPWA